MDVWENSTRESACLLKFIASRDLNNNRILKLNKRKGYEKKKIKRIIENYNKSKKANNGKRWIKKMNQKYISNCVDWKDWKNKLTKIKTIEK